MKVYVTSDTQHYDIQSQSHVVRTAVRAFCTNELWRAEIKSTSAASAFDMSTCAPATRRNLKQALPHPVQGTEINRNALQLGNSVACR